MDELRETECMKTSDGRSWKKAAEPYIELLRGAYDLHIHPSPSPFNRPVGGLNPYAVRNALKRGAKIVFMPTRDAENSLRSGDMAGDFFQRPGIGIVTEEGKLKQTVYEIMEALRDYGAVLATGHISPKESMLLCREGVRFGVRMLLTHPEFSRTKFSVLLQKELADMGVMIEKCWYNIAERECTAKEMAAHIRAVGAGHCYLTTDRGQLGRELPVEALACFMMTLSDAGISRAELVEMTHAVPEQILFGI